LQKNKDMAFSYSAKTNPNRVRENTASKRKAEGKVKRVDEKRDAKGGPMIKSLFGKSTEGKRVGGEYKMGLADSKLFGGAGKRALKKSGVVLEGDHAKHIKANRKAKAKKEKRGFRDPLLAKKGAYLKKRTDGLTDRQKDTLKRHSKHHTKKHMDTMIKLMREGKTFTQAHNVAMKKVGK
tara:strand:- start:1973 stop:2512 length:540 start_codon:yes stop_codon:yes gene_type:complete